jgi:hypothetical protein
VVWVRERTIPTKQPPLVAEVNANVCFTFQILLCLCLQAVTYFCLNVRQSIETGVHCELENIGATFYVVLWRQSPSESLKQMPSLNLLPGLPSILQRLSVAWHVFGLCSMGVSVLNWSHISLPGSPVISQPCPLRFKCGWLLHLIEHRSSASVSINDPQLA